MRDSSACRRANAISGNDRVVAKFRAFCRPLVQSEEAMKPLVGDHRRRALRRTIGHSEDRTIGKNLMPEILTRDCSMHGRSDSGVRCVIYLKRTSNLGDLAVLRVK